MYNQPYFIPNFYPPITPPFLRRTIANKALRELTSPRDLGIAKKIGNSLATLKNIKWGEMINNTSKTLGIINQTIPIVKQVKPMMTNMTSIIKVASLFKDETEPNQIRKNHPQKNNNIPKKDIQKEDYSPTFFIQS